MHTFLFIAAYLSATTVATPVAQLFDSFETDYATLSNQQDIKILPIDFTNTVGDSNAPPLAVLTGDTTTPSYLQAQVPPQDSFSNFGGGCPAQKLFCCQGGSGPPGALISDASFQAKCIPCRVLYFIYIYYLTPKLVCAACNMFAKSHVFR